METVKNVCRVSWAFPDTKNYCSSVIYPYVSAWSYLCQLSYNVDSEVSTKNIKSIRIFYFKSNLNDGKKHKSQVKFSSH